MDLLVTCRNVETEARVVPYLARAPLKVNLSD